MIPILAVVDWSVIINALSLGVVMILTTYMKLKMSKADTQRDEMKRTLHKVERQSDGASTALKKAVAISAENLALVTKKPAHKKVAIEAWEDYEASVHMQKLAAMDPTEGVGENLRTILVAAEDTVKAADDSSKAALIAKEAATAAAAKVVDTATHLMPPSSVDDKEKRSVTLEAQEPKPQKP